MGKIEEVKNILCKHIDPINWIDEMATEICQLFEPKPDEGRLLTDAKKVLIKKLKPHPAFRQLPDALEAMAEMVIQLGYGDVAKTASIKDAEFKKLEIDYNDLWDTLDETIKAKNSECQARIEALIEEIKLSQHEDGWVIMCPLTLEEIEAKYISEVDDDA